MFKKIEVSEDTFKKLNFLQTYWNYSNPNMCIERMIRHYSRNHHINCKPVANAISKCSSGDTPTQAQNTTEQVLSNPPTDKTVTVNELLQHSDK